MTLVVATGIVYLPFVLNVCAIGPTVPALEAHVEEADVTIHFPPSMTEGAVGKSIYPTGWAWWVVDRIFVEASAPLDSITSDLSDTDRMRDVLQEAAQIAVRRLLNSYRWRLNQPQVHPVKIDPAQFRLEMVHADGSRDALPEPVGSFFFHHTPSEAPLDRSVTEQTLERIQRDVLEGIEPPHGELLALDITWLESIGESNRAAELKEVCAAPE